MRAGNRTLVCSNLLVQVFVGVFRSSVPHACRERNDGLYRVITYLCYKMLEELIVAILISVVVACIVFYGVQLKGQWVTFWLTYLVTLACGVGESLFYLFFRRHSHSCTTHRCLQEDSNSLETDAMRLTFYCHCTAHASGCCQCDDLGSSRCAHGF